MNNHHVHPEVWFRPSPLASFDVLLTLFQNREITITPRLGVRNGFHPKGYKPGQLVTLRLFGDDKQEKVSLKIRVDDIRIQPLNMVQQADLAGSHFYRSWADVQRELSFFEDRSVEPVECVSLIRFSYEN
jgi:hypothetical protein